MRHSAANYNRNGEVTATRHASFVQRQIPRDYEGSIVHYRLGFGRRYCRVEMLQHRKQANKLKYGEAEERDERREKEKVEGGQ